MSKKPRQPKAQLQLRTSIMVVRLTEDERERFEYDANKRGLQLSTWARMLLLEKLKQREREGV
jgi:hypothetical protein